MEKILKIEIPEGYEIDNEKSTFEKIVFKPIVNNKPRSWEEFIDLQSVKYAYIGNYCNEIYGPNTMGAFFKLLCLYNSWIKDWKPDWEKSNSKYVIRRDFNEIKVSTWWHTNAVFAFPTEEMATEFLDTFRDLFEQAKELI